MPDAKSRTKRERENTDRSLRDERSKSDAELAKRQSVVEQKADEVVDRARRRADDVLTTARGRADRKLERGGATAAELEAVGREREAEDASVATEREIARQQLELERARRTELVAELLILERTRTDEQLALERKGADAVVTTRDEFLGIVTHDLRSLLQGVAMSAWSILREAGDDAGMSHIRNEALRTERYVARMNRLVGDLLDVVSIDAGKLSVVPTQEDAVKLVRDAAEIFRPLAAAQRIDLTINAEGEPLHALVDRERITQVLANLVTNAIKFTDEGGTIVVGVRAVDTLLEFSVRDTGSGIPDDKVHTIFDRFAQVANDRRGLGLGLHISRSIVQAHRGRIWVESRVGEGSTFRFTVPAA